MTKNNEKAKRTCYVIGECCGQLSKLFVISALISFAIGVGAELRWDFIERREMKNNN